MTTEKPQKYALSLTTHSLSDNMFKRIRFKEITALSINKNKEWS